jgi:hypothetical protein
MSHRRFAWRAAVILAVATAVHAQSGEPDPGELAVLGGATLGAGTHAAVAGSAGLAFSRYGMGLFTFTFMPLGHNTIQPWPAPSTVDRSFVYDFGVDFHVRIPVKPRFAPYLIVGSGLLWDTVRQHTVDASGAPVVRHFDQFNAALHTGGGMRYYIGEKWGIRPEVKVIVSKQVYTQVMIGFFYVTPPDWP